MDLISSTDPAKNNRSPLRSHRDLQNIYILFAEFSDQDISSIISYLRDNQFTPRAKSISSIDELLSALSERSWDLIICQSQKATFNPILIAEQLTRLEKDIPVLQLLDAPEITDITEGLLNNFQGVLPSDDYKLLLFLIRREYVYLESRRLGRSLQVQLSDSQKRCKLLMDNSALAIGFISIQKIVYLNEAFGQLFGYQVKDLLLNKSILSLIAAQERSGMTKLLSDFTESGHPKLTYQLLAQRADKSNFTAHIELQQVQFNGLECIEIVINTDKKSKKHSKFSEIDAITGLYNYDYFLDSLENSVRLAQHGGNDCHLLQIDILNFSHIRGQFGSEASRSLARDIADMLNDLFNPTHLKARLSDHLFAVIFMDTSPENTQAVAEKLCLCLQNQRCHFDQPNIAIEPAIAIIKLTDTAPNASQILKRAQATLLKCASFKAEQPKVLLYSAEHLQENSAPILSIADVRQAIEHNHLRLVYQPLVPLVFNSEQQHYEVLLRMVDQDRQLISPALFLPSFGEANLNEEMDRWVIAESVKRFEKKSNNKQLKFFISVTDTVWERDILLVWVADLIRQSRIQADHIVIQISESESAHQLPQAKYFVDGLRQLNCLVCLKHYGSTNNSEDVLKILDPDYIKFDGSFIRELNDGTSEDSNFQALLNNLKNLGKITIAPQVETPKVMSLLWKSGVGMIQGYYLQAPDEEMNYDFDQK
jgi:diguanylate cyclase (GGDEF)-like protein